MATALQRQRMAAVRSALELLRHQQFTAGCNLVVLGGACAPSTNYDTGVFNNIDNKNFDSDTLASPHLLPPPCTLIDRHLVVCGGVIATTHTRLDVPIPTLALCGTNISHSRHILRNRPLRPPCIGALALVVPARFGLWHRTGIG